jgi:hypothetical protein
MRRFILTAALVLASAAAQAGDTRSLITQANDEQAVESSAAKAEASAPKYVARPAAVAAEAEQPKAEAKKPVAENAAPARRVEKPRRQREATEARVIRELNRHGIYW